MDPQVWIVGIIVVLEAYWPIVAVAALLVLGPLLGFVIVAVIGAVRTAVVPHEDDEGSAGTDDLFARFDDTSLVHDRNDSI